MSSYAAGFYIVTYALGIYNLNLLLGFLTPQVDPELEGPTLPSKGQDEFRPFVRRLPEFKFWCATVGLPCHLTLPCPVCLSKDFLMHCCPRGRMSSGRLSGGCQSSSSGKSSSCFHSQSVMPQDFSARAPKRGFPLNLGPCNFAWNMAVSA